MIHSKEEALKAVRQNGLELQNCSKLLQDNLYVVLTAANQNGWALQYASKKLKFDRVYA